ncbi:uncharacterized protein EI90DRAFT_3011022 [Cantharellus anzutake]|uniref:uncharacterized protein n=1 Tax=Cantharellus anzutake TaxID=1750568 RepID=UPI001908F146|nr:uncharacterized protein EI90DRAFT_3011022 [Cantharellus anzutake]KAF8344256.1 hypothetical protein EI90DRAFT_3011022 [Cantharellus anzutake]
MESTIVSRLLAHTQAENFLGSIDASSLSYKSAASSNGQSICGSWVLQEKRNVWGEFALFGIISMTERSKVNATRYQMHLSMPSSAPRMVKKLFADQIRALNRIKNASGLGVHCEEDMIEIHENEFGWAYLDDQNCPFLRILHPMFLESRASPLKEGKKVNVSLALESDPASPASVTTSNNDATPSVFSHPQWDPEGHYRRALPSPNMQRDFKFHVDLHAFDDDGRNGSHRHCVSAFIVGRAGALQEEPIAIASSSKKRIAEEELLGPPKCGPFFTRNGDNKKREDSSLDCGSNNEEVLLLPPVEELLTMDHHGKGKEVASKALSGYTQGKLDSKQDTSLDVKEPVVIEDEVMYVAHNYSTQWTTHIRLPLFDQAPIYIFDHEQG